jgi:hypothetical protein
MNLRTLDLNLLVVLDALLDEAHVGRAADRLGLSQPAASAALQRCRHAFRDELLERGRGTMRLTPKAETLRAPLKSLLAGVTELMDPPEIPLADICQTLRITAADYPALIRARPARPQASRGPGRPQFPDGSARPDPLRHDRDAAFPHHARSRRTGLFCSAGAGHGLSASSRVASPAVQGCGPPARRRDTCATAAIRTRRSRLRPPIRPRRPLAVGYEMLPGVAFSSPSSIECCAP